MPPVSSAATTASAFVSFRLARAQRLTDGTPLELTAVINEAALRLNLGRPEVRQAQYRHLLKLAKLPNVSIQLLRPEDGPHRGYGRVLRLDFDRARSVAYSEHLDGAV
jgi:hypothetical protein